MRIEQIGSGIEREAFPFVLISIVQFFLLLANCSQGDRKEASDVLSHDKGAGKNNKIDLNVVECWKQKEIPKPKSIRTPTAEECRILSDSLLKIKDQKCKDIDRNVGIKAARRINCGCKNNVGRCCFYVGYRLTSYLSDPDLIHDLGKKYWAKGCALGCPLSCLAYVETVGKLTYKEAARIWKNEKELFREIVKICEQGNMEACQLLMDVATYLFDAWNSKEKKKQAVEMINRYGTMLCHARYTEGCFEYVGALSWVNRNIGMAYEIALHFCEEEKDDAACSVAFQLADPSFGVHLDHMGGFLLRWKSCIYGEDPREPVHNWLYECKGEVKREFKEYCGKWRKRVEEYEKHGEKESDPGCGYKYEEFRCPEEIEARMKKKKFKRSKYFRIIKDYVDPSIMNTNWNEQKGASGKPVS